MKHTFRKNAQEKEINPEYVDDLTNECIQGLYSNTAMAIQKRPQILPLILNNLICFCQNEVGDMKVFLTMSKRIINLSCPNKRSEY